METIGSLSASIQKEMTRHYGMTLIPVSKKDRMLALTEIETGIGIKTEAKTLNTFDKTIRKVDMWRIPKPSKIYDIFEKTGKEANKLFNYDISEIGDIQYLEYRVGDYYNIHSDVDNGTASKRKISMSWVLDSKYDGGDFKIYAHGEGMTVNITPSNILAFTSWHEHSVSIVTEGVRRCLVCWYIGEQWR
jgi:Rps23 Pro-64 3,4-dihydroxylase Tpa1-like proline 4-hydroxylase